MQRSSAAKNPLRRITAGLSFVLLLSAAIAPAPAQSGAICLSMPDCARKRLSLTTPEFLAPATATGEKNGGEDETAASVTPFIGPDQTLARLPTPERPAVSASDEIPLERPEVTAGIKVDLGTVKFNLGYTLPSGQVDDFVRPLGVDLQPGGDSKRFSLGVKIPF